MPPTVSKAGAVLTTECLAYASASLSQLALRIGTLVVLLVATACSGATAQATATSTPEPSPSAISTTGLAVAPSPSVTATNDEIVERAKRSAVCGKNSFVSTAAVIDGRMFVGCRNEGIVLVVDRRMRILQSRDASMYSVESISAAGTSAIAVAGYSDGAVLTNQLAILDAATLKPIIGPLNDSTLLGVIRDRAYIDDWCCFGRADTYAPATIYSMSMKDGEESRHIDLAPDPQSHPARLAPMGQGEHNYMRGHYFYVVVTDDNIEGTSVTYRYDIFQLSRPPVRMRTSTCSFEGHLC